MELSNKLTTLRKQIDKVEKDIKEDVISHQDELFRYSERYSGLNDYEIDKTSRQLCEKTSQLKSRIDRDHEALCNDVDDLINVESALKLLRQVFKFKTLASLLDRRLQNTLNEQDVAQIVLTIEELERLLQNEDLRRVQVVYTYKAQLQHHKAKISSHLSKTPSMHAKSSSIDQLKQSNKGFLNNVFDNLAI